MDNFSRSVINNWETRLLPLKRNIIALNSSYPFLDKNRSDYSRSYIHVIHPSMKEIQHTNYIKSVCTCQINVILEIKAEQFTRQVTQIIDRKINCIAFSDWCIWTTEPLFGFSNSLYVISIVVFQGLFEEKCEI